MPSSACSAAYHAAPSFPTRRSSDLTSSACSSSGPTCTRRPARAFSRESSESSRKRLQARSIAASCASTEARAAESPSGSAVRSTTPDRKSTRLNSSHVSISYAVFCLLRRLPRCALVPYTTLFRSHLERLQQQRPHLHAAACAGVQPRELGVLAEAAAGEVDRGELRLDGGACRRKPVGLGRAEHDSRSEEHTSELQSRFDLVCRLLLAPPPTTLRPRSLHDALPISPRAPAAAAAPPARGGLRGRSAARARSPRGSGCRRGRSRRAAPRRRRVPPKARRARPCGARLQIGRAHV